MNQAGNELMEDEERRQQEEDLRRWGPARPGDSYAIESGVVQPPDTIE